MKACWIAFAIAISGSHVVISPVFGNEDLKKRFLADYEPAAEILRNTYVKNRQAKLIEVNYSKNGDLLSKFEHQLLSNEDCILAKRLLLIRTARRAGKAVGEPVEPPTIKWELLRPDFLFVIAPAEQPDEYRMTEMIQVASWEEVIKKRPVAILSLFLPLAYQDFPIATYVRRPELMVLGLSESSWKGRQLVQLRIREPGPPNNATWIRSFYFDPKDHWLLHGIESQKEGSSQKIIQQNHYRSGDDGINIPVKTELYSEQQGQLQQRFWLIDYLEFLSAHPDTSEFSLGRFGLPEPVRIDKPTRWYLWIGLAGVCSLVVALYLKLKKRRAVEGKG